MVALLSMAKTLKTLGFQIDGRNKNGKFVFKVTVKKYENYRRFRVRATPKGEKRIDKEFSDEWECRDWINSWKTKNEPSMEGWRDTQTMLSPEELNDAQVAVKLLPRGVTLCEAVSQFKQRSETIEIRVSNAWDEYRNLMVRTEENRDGKWRSPKTVIEKDHFFKPIIQKIGGQRIKDLEEEDLPKFWNNKRWGDQSRLNRFKAMKAFFGWCKVKRYHHENLMEHQQTPTVRRNSLPRTFTLEESEKLIKASLQEKFRPIRSFIALCLYGGLRAGEIHDNWNAETGLRWENFTLDPPKDLKPEVFIPFIGKKKINQYRYLPPKCVKILKEEQERGYDVIPKKNGINRWKQIRHFCGLSNVGSNVARRTAISCFYRHNPFTGKSVTDESVLDDHFGNTEDVRNKHYKDGSVTITEAKKFWQIAD